MFKPVSQSIVRYDVEHFAESSMGNVASIDEGVNFIQIAHGKHAGEGQNFIRICAKARELRPLMEECVSGGWFLCKSSPDLSTLVRADFVPRFWHRITSGEFSVDEAGTIHTLSVDNSDRRARALIVVFSSMAETFDDASLSRFFYQNFKSLGKHLDSGFAVLRIADMDGVVGGFYAPTRFAPDRIARVESLIASTAESLGVESDRVILYGASKGGSGALLYGLSSRVGWKCVAVDPVVDDAYYESAYNDSHWTGGSIFLHRKVDLYGSLADGLLEGDSAPRFAVITSRRSPLFSQISELVQRMPAEATSFFVSPDPSISQHSEVSPKTMRLAAGIMNVWANGMDLQPLWIDSERD